MDPDVPFIEVALNPGDVVADRFRLVRELGRGAMGAVWLAHHEALDVPCAVKFIAEQRLAMRELRFRFEREARAAAQIRSPHVVQILDHGIWMDQPYIAMEYLEGEDLQSRLDRDGSLGPAATVELVSQVARGLLKAHGLGIIHRDLKPENLFLVREHDGALVKILDFGIAKKPAIADESHSKTRTGALLGTPYYMSPEQADGTKAVDHRSDLWALAVIAYRCIVGRLPFDSEAVGDLLMRIMHRPIPVPSEVDADVPAGFDAWWARASSRDPDARFQSAKDLADSLADALAVRRESTSGALALAEPRPSNANSDGTELGRRSPLAATSGPGLGALSATNAPEALRATRRGHPLLYGSLGLVSILGLAAVALIAARGPRAAPGSEGARPAESFDAPAPATVAVAPSPEAPPASAVPAPASAAVEPVASARPPTAAKSAKPPRPVSALPKPPPKSPSSAPAEPPPRAKADMGF